MESPCNTRGPLLKLQKTKEIFNPFFRERCGLIHALRRFSQRFSSGLSAFLYCELIENMIKHN